MNSEEFILKKGDNIHFIIYRDHAFIQGEKLDLDLAIKKAREDPKLLFCVGKIVNLEDNDPFYMVISSGAVKHLRKPWNYETIEKSCIISMEVIKIIP